MQSAHFFLVCDKNIIFLKLLYKFKNSPTTLCKAKWRVRKNFLYYELTAD